MAASKAKTVGAYLKELPPERRAVISSIRQIVLKNLPKGYSERMNWGMISYEIPLEAYPDTYNNQPLLYLAIAAQKHHYGFYAMNVYSMPGLEKWLRDEFGKAGKNIDMGKSCIRFKHPDDLPAGVIAGIVKATTVKKFIAAYELSRS